jgi:L-methionine (R)-S-oxide reductase
VTTFESDKIPYNKDFFGTLQRSLEALVSAEADPIAQLANSCALLFYHFEDLNWCGFYLLRGNTLVVGPFQGKPACTRIALGRGVCGTAAHELKTIRVDDVHEFPGHIACDAASKSELVVPLSTQGKLRGVLDLDSPSLARFSIEDALGFENICRMLEKKIQWAAL